MSPGELTTMMPCLNASPDRGCTNPAKPCGMAKAMPVPTSRRSPAGMVTSSTANRSAPPSPGMGTERQPRGRMQQFDGEIHGRRPD